MIDYRRPDFHIAKNIAIAPLCAYERIILAKEAENRRERMSEKRGNVERKRT